MDHQAQARWARPGLPHDRQRYRGLSHETGLTFPNCIPFNLAKKKHFLNLNKLQFDLTRQLQVNAIVAHLKILFMFILNRARYFATFNCLIRIIKESLNAYQEQKSLDFN